MAHVMTLEEVASYLRVHPSTIYRLLKKRQLPAFKVGSDWRFNQESIDQWRTNAEGLQRPDSWASGNKTPSV
ncbi:MAG TPA: helix-turn-helix domain-containing protein [Candidatus Binataceae bacterium]|nr:helix-turn-helix domain-containing protein [Candidatus Binataceae bacterium]